MDTDISRRTALGLIGSAVAGVAGLGASPCWAKEGAKPLNVEQTPRQRVISTGFDALDDLLGGGLRPGTATVLASRPAVGKTALAMSIARKATEQRSIRVCLFSVEVPKEVISKCLLCAETRIACSELPGQESSDKVSAAQSSLEDRIFVDDTYPLIPDDVWNRGRELVNKASVGLLIVDYLKVMQESRPFSGAGGLALLEKRRGIFRRLKQVALDLNVPVLAVSQVRRSLQFRETNPDLSDVWDSGVPDGETDAVIILHREIDDKGWSSNDATVTVELNRYGNTGQIPLRFFPGQYRFETPVNC